MGGGRPVAPPAASRASRAAATLTRQLRPVRIVVVALRTIWPLPQLDWRARERGAVERGAAVEARAAVTPLATKNAGLGTSQGKEMPAESKRKRNPAVAVAVAVY